MAHRVRRRTHTITFGAAFLGLTLECSRCRDHKYDPITQGGTWSLITGLLCEVGPYLTPPRSRSRSIAAATPSLRAVDRGAGDQHASARLDDQRRGLVIDPAVNLQLAVGAE